MKIVAQSLFTSDETFKNESKSRRKKLVPVSEARTVEEDHSYFESYAHYSIHYEMLSDHTRTSSYRTALLDNPGRLSDALVLDIGCGTGILSMFAAQAGAKAVVGVDCSDIIYQAMDIVRENGLEGKVSLVKGRLEETQLPHEKFDIIVSEWMGYFLLFEGMLDSVLAARDKYLAPGGMVLPSRCSIHLAALSDVDRYNGLVDFWGDVYGFKMSCMRNPILEEASVEVVPLEHVVSNSVQVLDLDINKCTVADSEFDSEFVFDITRDSDLTAVIGYFDTFFELEKPVMFSTGPQSTPTHWKQTVFYLPEKIPVVKGQRMQGRIVCKRMVTDARSIKVSLVLDGKTYRYTVD
jgi:protein arginine N-methyltransferase 3